MSDGVGLGGDWAADYTSWRRELDNFFAGLATTEVNVLVWGPGPHQKEWFPKRQKIVDDLRKMSRYNDVFTSEELIERHPHLKTMGVREAEETQAELADLIVSLWVRDDGVTGAPTEMLLFGPRQDLQKKMRVLKPWGWAPPGLVTQVANDMVGEFLPQSQYLEYSNEQFKECNDIRARCRAWVEAVRAAKYRREQREHA